MTKIIFFDIDGTLLSFRTHQVPTSTIEAVRQVRERGVKVWIATGRPLPFISNLGTLEYDGLMCVNGGHCRIQTNEQPNDKATIIHSQPVNQADVERMVAEQHKSGMAVVYASNDNTILTAPKGIPSTVTNIFTLLNITQPALAKPEEALGMEVMQVIAFFSEAEQEYIMTHVLKSCDATRWHPDFADCISKGTDKASGIDHVLRHYGFNINEAMAFGDGGNDIQMLRHAGIGVAMGNANDEVKAAADIVTKSVDDDGVADILNKYILHQA